jgi:hypothetical protein
LFFKDKKSKRIHKIVGIKVFLPISVFLLDDRRIRIREAQKHMDSDPDPEHWFKFSNIFSFTGQEEEGGMGEGQPFGGGGGLRLPPKQGLIPLSQHRVRAEVRREFIPHPGGLPLAVGDVVLFAELCDCSQGCPFGKFRYWTLIQLSSVSDPERDWVRIQSSQWIRIRIQEGKNYQKKMKKIEKFHVLKCWMLSEDFCSLGRTLWRPKDK